MLARVSPSAQHFSHPYGLRQLPPTGTWHPVRTHTVLCRGLTPSLQGQDPHFGATTMLTSHESELDHANLGGRDLYSLFRMSCPPLPRECSVISEKEETGYWAASTVFVPSRDWLNKLQFIKKLEYSATKTMRKIWINHYRKASLTWLTEKSTVAEDPISIISFLFEGK